jgi:HTH-type transcriptional regulator/antitoxin HigA
MTQATAEPRTEAFQPDYAVHPGETIAEWLEEQSMTQAEFAVRIGMSAKALNQMVRGHAPVTPETSLRLEAVTGIPARTWNALQALYAEDLARIQRDARLAEQVSFLQEIPMGPLRSMGIVTAPKRDKVAALRQVCDFFGVSDAEAWKTYWQSPAAAYRKSAAFQADPGAMAVWLRLGELAARDAQVSEFDRDSLINRVPELRALTLEPDASVFVPKMTRICADAGVVVRFIPEVKGARCSGASRWIWGRPLVQLSLRHKSDDHLWFTFFHELGHVLLHNRHEVFIDDGKAQSPESQAFEDEADGFARETLIPAEFDPELPELTRLADMVGFAQRIGVSPGVVVGRLQHDGVIGFHIGNHIKRRYTFAVTG